MGYIALALLIIGILLLLAEVFVPGFGVFGISGLLALFSAAAITIMYVENGVAIVITGIVVITAFICIVVDLVKRNGAYGHIVLKDTLDDPDNGIKELSSLIGREGTVKTPLRPNGRVAFGDTVTEAYSEGEFYPAGSKVKACKIHDGHLYVQSIEENQNVSDT